MVAYAIMSMLEPDYRWLEGDVLQIALRILGWELESQAGGATTAGRIVEVEAYHGTNDPASHAYAGRTPRTMPMFDIGGTVYVYLSYGIHACMNIVTGPAGEASALLIRALEPTQGINVMTQRRHTTALPKLTTGPGNLSQALGITVALSGTRLGTVLSLRPPTTPTPSLSIAIGPRIGISRATDYPWRFSLKHNPFVSPPRM